MHNYIMNDCIIYKDETESGRTYAWGSTNLTLMGGSNYLNVEGRNPFDIRNEKNLEPWLKCARQDTTYVPPTKNPKRTRWVVDDAAVMQSIQTGKFPDGTDCTTLQYTFENGNYVAKRVPWIFNVAPNVESYVVTLEQMGCTPGEMWVPMATQQTTINTIKGKITVAPGMPIPGKNGQFVPIQAIRVNVICFPELGPDGRPQPAEDPVEKAKTRLERRYICLNPRQQQNVDMPSGPAQHTETPEDVQRRMAEEEAARRAALYGNTNPQQQGGNPNPPQQAQFTMPNPPINPNPTGTPLQAQNPPQMGPFQPINIGD